MMRAISITTDKEIEACFAVMSQLRPHLPESEFVSRVRAQMAEGYRLAAIVEEDGYPAVAGYRIGLNLAWGRYLYVDDLVTDQARRSGGCGKALLHWLFEEARREGCAQVHLDSGLQRKDAHRFYLREGMAISSHHFSIRLPEA